MADLWGVSVSTINSLQITMLPSLTQKAWYRLVVVYPWIRQVYPPTCKQFAILAGFVSVSGMRWKR
jgi:hypothetical protein